MPLANSWPQLLDNVGEILMMTERTECDRTVISDADKLGFRVHVNTQMWWLILVVNLTSSSTT